MELQEVDVIIEKDGQMMFQEFIEPYDQRLLHEFGGGAIHFCGRGDHYIHRLAQMKGVFAINLSQPECNDMETIFEHTADKRIKILGLPRYGAEQALQQGHDLHGSVHCWYLKKAIPVICKPNLTPIGCNMAGEIRSNG